MLWHTEFPEYPAMEMISPPEGCGFEETSWHNDGCPSFTSYELGIKLWVDYPHPDDREFPGADRFSVETETEALETNDWVQVIAFILERKFAKMSADQLNDWYEQTVGYRPQVDEPNMTDEDLRVLCASYVKAVAEESE